MKLLKKLAILASAIVLCLGAGACMGGGSSSSASSSAAISSSDETPATVYTFIVLNADGTPAKDINVQLCVLGNDAACFMPIPTNENGVVEYNPTGFPGEGEYEIHLFTLDMTTSLTFDGPVSTPTIYGTITLTLK